jgi:hypothetical protein
MVVLPPKKLIYLLLFLESLFVFCLGIVEIVFLIQNPQLKDECENLYTWIFIAALSNMLIPAVTACGLQSYDGTENDGQFLQIAQIVIMIWSVVTYFHIDSECLDIWIQTAPSFWIFVLIPFSGFWIVTVSASIFCCVFINNRYQSNKLKRQVENITQEIVNEV